MKLKPGECDYPLADCGLIELVVLDEGRPSMRGIVYQMIQVPPLEWERMRGDRAHPPARGRPQYFAWFTRDAMIRVWPAPSEPHDLRVRYYGHLREV